MTQDGSPNTPPQTDPRLVGLSTLLALQQEARLAETVQELAFFMTNQTRKLVDYQQAYLWKQTAFDHAKIISAAGVAQIDSQAIQIQWLQQTIHAVQKQQDLPQPEFLDASFLQDSHLREEWEKWAPPYALYCPIFDPQGKLMGGIWFVRPTPWQEREKDLLTALMQAYGHAWWALERKPHPIGNLWHRLWRKKNMIYGGLAALTIMIWPVHLTVLAPARIVPKDPAIIASPIDGVITEFYVKPNDIVTKGQPLFRLDETAALNQYKVSEKALEVARAELRKASQEAFNDPLSKAKVAVLEGQLRQKEAELRYTQDLLARIDVKADQSGIAIYSDENDWLGRPVVTGERVMMLADPGHAEIEISMPVNDAILLPEQAKVKMFLNTNPLLAIPAKLSYASFEASMMENQVYGYHLKAALTQSKDDNAPRIGAQGTAKIYGEKVSLFYFLFRRPIAFVRRNLGF